MRERSNVVNTALAEKPEIIRFKQQTKKQLFLELQKSKEQRKILETQLMRSQKLETLGALVSGIAHDFNNILNVIVGYSQLIPDMLNDPEEFSRAVEAISKASNRGAELVKQLLSFVKKSKTNFIPVDINGIISEIKKLIKNTFPKVILVSLDLENGLPTINADPTQIHQILLNLCINSRDAMKKGGLIYITTKVINYK